MKETFVFSVDVPRTGMHLDAVEWGGFRVRTLGPLVSVEGPFPIGPHDNYTALTDCDGHVQIVQLKPGDYMDREAREIFDLLSDGPIVR
jgi:hypothetical protein